MSFKVYNPQVERTAAPAYRQRIDNSVSAGMASLAEGARGVAAGADELRQQIRDEQDVAALQDAYRQLSDAKQHLLDDPNEGFIAKRGRDAIEAGKKYVGSFDDTAKRIGEGLRSDRQKQAFTRTLGDERRGFLDTVDRHVAGQSVVVADQARDGAMTAGFSEAVAASKRGDIDIAQKAIAKGAAAAADIPGADPGFIAAQQAAYVTQAHLGIIDGMMEGGQTTAAEKYLEAHRGEMDAALLAKSNIEKSIRLAGDAETGARLARGMIGGASGTVVRPWDPKTQIPHLDTSRVMAELAKVEADPSVPEHVKQATREHAEALVRSNDATWKSMLDDTYDRAVTKLSTNGWRLSSLSQEQAFLLSPDVDGGRVWQSILAHRDSVLRARSGAP